MIHETLFYLLNCPSVTLKFQPDEEIFDKLEFQNFIHPSEKKLLQRILSVGFSYHWIENFIKTVNEQNIIKFEANKGKDSLIKYEDKNILQPTIPGLYIKAFCKGLDECLEEYRKDIVKLEEMYLNNASINLTYILSYIEKYVVLFDALKSMIYMVERDEIRGCQIIGKLQRYLEYGTEAVINATKKIMCVVNGVFFRQLCNWIIYGDLLDLYDEFFICDGKELDENFLNGEHIPKNNETIFDTFKKGKLRKTSPIQRFYLKQELFPFDSVEYLAEVILFMGQIVWIVRNDPKEKIETKLNFRYKRDIWEGKDVEYYQKIQSLESKIFSISEFEKVIEECRLKIAKYLWDIMVEEANLLDHLQLIRDYFGLGRGELFQQFIVSAENQLKENPTALTTNNLNFIFKETARKMYGENDKTHKKFEMVTSKICDKKCADSWSNLAINFEVEWPLHIIFHPKTLNLYNRLFSYLLRIKKTHIDLHKLWLLHTRGKRKINPILWSLRNTLMFIVNNIQYYLQVDVIEAQFSILKESFKNANEFGDITRYHSIFLANLLSKTFILSMDEDLNQQNKEKYTLYQTPALIFAEGDNLVYKVILQILELCDKFCLLVSTWNHDLLESEINQLEEMKTESETLIHVLLKVLYNLHERVSGHHLLQLLQRIDFNKWFTKKKKFNLMIPVV